MKKHELSDKTLEDIVTPYDHEELDIVKATGFNPIKTSKRVDKAIHDIFCEDCNDNPPGMNYSIIAEIIDNNVENRRELAVYAAFLSVELNKLLSHPVVRIIKAMEDE